MDYYYNMNSNNKNMNKQETTNPAPAAAVDAPMFRSVALPARTPLARESSPTLPPQRKFMDTMDAATPFKDDDNFMSPLATTTWAPTDCLRQLSFYHPLEPCHATFAQKHLGSMLQQLQETFRALSCHVDYEDNTLAATCRTMNAVEFFVSLWQGRGNNADCIIVEIQRVAGDSYAFHSQYAQPLLAVVKQQQPPSAIETNPAQNPAQTGRALDQLAATTTTTTTINDDERMQALEMAADLVMNDRYDARQLGLESLVHLTDPTQTGCQTAFAVAQALQNNQDSQPLTKLLWALFLERQPTEFGFAALQIWTQVWQVLAANNNNQSNDNIVLPPEGAQAIVQRLLDYVNQVHNMPHHATLALRGLTALCQCDAHVQSSIAWNQVQHAQAVGQAQHAALQQASGQLLAVHS